jgi:squalene-associated FAD-dependent desaturase
MESPALNRLPVAVVGGGIAGISAAFHLSQAGVSTILFERGPRLGGRISSFPDSDFGMELDLGVHIISGSYKHFINLLRGFGTDKDLHWIRPLHLPFQGIGTPKYHLHFWPLPGIWGAVPGLLRYQALTFSERRHLIGQISRMASMRSIPPISVETWLSSVGATDAQMSRFWEPLILATLNATPRQVSLIGLQQIIVLGLSQSRGFNLGLPTRPWQKIVGDAAQSCLSKHGVEVRLRARVTQIITEAERVSAVVADGQRWPVSAIIVAVSPWDWKRIFSREQFSLFLDAAWLAPNSSAIHSTYFLFDMKPPIPWPMTGLLEMTNQWVFVRGLASHPPDWLVATVSSASDPLLCEREERILSSARKELQALWPDFATEPRKARCVRMKRATCPFSADLEKRRPRQETPIQGLFLASDATQTRLPATLESAARAGFLAAKAVIEKSRGKSLL